MSVSFHKRWPKNLIKSEDRDLFDAEIRQWISNGVVVKHDSILHGDIKCFLPMIGVRQVKGDSVKVRPVWIIENSTKQ